MSGMAARGSTQPIHSGVKLTYDDFLLFPDDRRRHELIDGVHYVTAAPGNKHQVILGNLHWLIRSYLETRPIGRVYLPPFDVVFSFVDVVEPDLLYLSNDRAEQVLTPKHLAGAPELAVEIGSPGTRKRDETVKKRLYERFGVSEYWVIETRTDLVRIFRHAGDRFGRPVELLLERGDVLTTPLLPGLKLPLAQIFKQ